MKSSIATAIGLETQPVALVWADQAPEGANRFKPERWGCVVSLFAAAATKGRAGAFDWQTFGCWGGGVGLGFGNQYDSFPGGMECFCRFLADGNEQSEDGRAIGEHRGGRAMPSRRHLDTAPQRGSPTAAYRTRTGGAA